MLSLNTINTGRGKPIAPSRRSVGATSSALASNPNTGLGKRNTSENPAERHARLYPVQKPNRSATPNYVPAFHFIAGSKLSKDDAYKGGSRNKLKEPRVLAKNVARSAVVIKSAKTIAAHKPSTSIMSGLEYITNRKSRPNTPNRTIGAGGIKALPPVATTEIKNGLNNLPQEVITKIGNTITPNAVSNESVMVKGAASTYADTADVLLSEENKANKNNGFNWQLLIMAALLVFLVVKGRA